MNADARLAPMQPGLDYHSFANVEQFRITHVDLNLRVDFPHMVLFGAVGLEIKRLDPRATELVLDTRDLDIRGVSEKATDVLGATSKSETTWVSRPFHFEKADPILGSPLVIELPPSKKTTQLIRIDYMTSPTASALQWLTEKQDPQQEPSAHVYAVRAHRDPQLDSAAGHASGAGHLYRAYSHLGRCVRRHERQERPEGEAQRRLFVRYAGRDPPLSDRPGGRRFALQGDRSANRRVCGIFLDIGGGEGIRRCGKHDQGGRKHRRTLSAGIGYDILVLPPSFPVGGMENPRLSFVSPTIIAGDKSLLAVIAHEVAHSWPGDLVTSATWRDLWLSEGLAGYLQSRIMDQVYGDRLEAMDRVLDLQSLRDDLARAKPEDQVLAIDLRDRDPSAAFNQVVFEKGRLFFLFLEAKFGRERFDAFMRDYFDHFAVQEHRHRAVSRVLEDQFARSLSQHRHRR